MNIPLRVEDLTADWLTAALSAAGSPAEVTEVRIKQVMAGTADKIIIEVDSPADSELPPTLCVKGGFNEALRPMAALGYLTEARFFGEVAPTLSAQLPRCWACEADETAQQGIVVLDDLGAAGCRFGDPLTGLSRDETAAGLETQARWHAATWNEGGLDSFPWIGPFSQMVRGFYELCLQPDLWNAGVNRLPESVAPASLRDPDRIASAVASMHELNTSGPRCLTHSDAHVGNTYVTPDGSLNFLDWQTFCRGHWVDDVALFLVGALSIAERRASEWDLLDHYVDALAGHGVPRSDLGDVKEQYCRQHLHGYFWAFLPDGYQTPERIQAMCERYATAITDHDTLGALGV